MDSKEMNVALQALTDGMIYLSESDYELDVMDWGVIAQEEVLRKIKEHSNAAAGSINEQDASAFFTKTIEALDPSDEFAAALAEQYKKLYAYLQANCSAISVYRAGEVNVHIYIVCFITKGHCFALHTISVET